MQGSLRNLAVRMRSTPFPHFRMFQKIIPAALAASSLLLTAVPAMAEDGTAKDSCADLPAREEVRCRNTAIRMHRQSVQAEFRAERRSTQEEQQTSYFQLMTQWRKSREALQGAKKDALQDATSAEDRQAAVRTFREQHRSIMEQKKEEQRTFREALRSERKTLLEEQKNTARTSMKNATLQWEERRRLLNQQRADRIKFTPWWENTQEESAEDADEAETGTDTDSSESSSSESSSENSSESSSSESSSGDAE